MTENKSFKFQFWMLVALVVAALLLVFNFDPIGGALQNAFGKGADRWAINIILVALTIYAFVRRK